MNELEAKVWQELITGAAVAFTFVGVAWAIAWGWGDRPQGKE